MGGCNTRLLPLHDSTSKLLMRMAAAIHSRPSRNLPPSSSGPGRRVLSPKTGVRLPVGVYVHLYSARKFPQVQATPHLPTMRRFAFASCFGHFRPPAALDSASSIGHAVQPRLRRKHSIHESLSRSA